MFSDYGKLLDFYEKRCVSRSPLIRGYLLSCQRSQYSDQAMACTTEKSCLGICQKQDSFLFSKDSRPALEAHPVPYTRGTGVSFAPPLKQSSHLSLVPRVRMSGAQHPLPHFGFLACCFIKLKDNFTFNLFCSAN
jgi:hypothetical protein